MADRILNQTLLASLIAFAVLNDYLRIRRQLLKRRNVEGASRVVKRMVVLFGKRKYTLAASAAPYPIVGAAMIKASAVAPLTNADLMLSSLLERLSNIVGDAQRRLCALSMHHRQRYCNKNC